MDLPPIYLEIYDTLDYIELYLSTRISMYLYIGITNIQEGN